MSLSYRPWKFSVIHSPEKSENVCITGDCDSLGNWRPENIIPLSYNESTNVWSVEINIPSDRDVRYRYYTCIKNLTGSSLKNTIDLWETNFYPRVIKQNQEPHDDQIDVFGMFDGNRKLECGWLTNGMVLELRIQKQNFQWVPECPVKKINMKLKHSTRSRCNKNLLEKPKDQNSSEILISLSNENGRFRKQDENGYPCDEIDSVIFRTRTFLLKQQGFVFEFIGIGDTEISKKYFSHLIFEEELHGSDGVVKIPIHSADHEYSGSLSVKYLIVQPVPEVNCSFEASYSKYWNNAWVGLEIGHRGAGVSFSQICENNAKCRENTIGSFKSAAQNGAHLIEFDVQLTNDKVPTIYHNFYVLLEVRNRIESPRRLMVLPFHKLNYEDLKVFQIYHTNEANGPFSFENDDQEEYSSFPTLEQVLHAVDPHIGFNVEIKYTSKLLDGSNEYDNPIDMNEYVDKILQVVYANAGRRYIVFSSFNADICTMARLKQNKYPVMFLTQGATKRYPPYLDQRMKNIENAINFANCADLLGIVAHSEDLLNDSKSIKLILNCNLVLFCWGDDNNNDNNIVKLKEQGVHGIIFDRIDQFGNKSEKSLFKNIIL